MTTIEPYKKLFNQLPTDTQAWLKGLRAQAFEQFNQSGFPTRKNEAWKYTSVLPLTEAEFTTASQAAEIPANVIKQLPAEGVYRAIFIDGHFQAHLSTLPDDVDCIALSQATKTQQDTIQKHLGQYADFTDHGFSALNLALFQEGLYLNVPNGVAIDAPIHCVYIGASDKTTSQLRNLIMVGESAQVSVIEHYIDANDIDYFCNSVTELLAGPSAFVEHYKIVQHGDKTFHVDTLQVEQQRDSSVTLYSIALNGLLTRSDTSVELAETGAECRLYGLYLADKQQHVDHHTKIHHAKPHCRSEQSYKGILNDKARAVFNGGVLVAKQAQKTDASQQNKNLLLSRTAEINTKPELEIYADDVKCAHGATVGQLDEDAVFYLRSRGLDAEQAQDLLIHAFAEDILQQIADPAWRETIIDYVNQRI